MHLSTRKGPPVEMFSGEDSENTIDDWLPALVRAAEWELFVCFVHSLITRLGVLLLKVAKKLMCLIVAHLGRSEGMHH